MRVDTVMIGRFGGITGNTSATDSLAPLAVLRHYYPATFIINHIHPVSAGQLLADNGAARHTDTGMPSYPARSALFAKPVIGSLCSVSAVTTLFEWPSSDTRLHQINAKVLRVNVRAVASWFWAAASVQLPSACCFSQVIVPCAPGSRAVIISGALIIPFVETMS